MRTSELERPSAPPPADRHRPRRPGVVDWVTTVDHKQIGILYVVTAFGFFMFGGVLAMLIRTELAEPGLQVMNADTYNQTFTMHGTVMVLLFAAQVTTGLANYFVPLQIGAADVAFPRMNALSYWLYLFGGLMVLSGYLTANGAARSGWTAYVPLSTEKYLQGAGQDLWIMGLAVVGMGGILGALNLVVTIFSGRMPGMTMFRMPLFTWTVLVNQLLILFAFPAITAALALLFLERNFGAAYFDPARGGDPVLWQHLFWFFGHPEVYIVILPAFGIMSEVIPVFSSKPLFGYRAMVFAVFAITALSFSVWAHHMFVTDAVNLPWFSIMSLLIAVPTGIKIFNWIGTMWRGAIRFTTAMLMALAFIAVFLIGGITGVFLASPPIDFDVNDTYYVVAHFHYVMVGGLLFALFAGLYYWFPKMTGRMLSERLGRLQFWLMFVGFNLTFFPQFILGLNGMPRRVADYLPGLGWDALNLASTVGGFLLGVSILPFLWNVYASLRRGRPAGDDPWEGFSLEWATSSPPPQHNFHELPEIRSERPVFDRRHAAAGAGAGGGDLGRDGGAGG
ncbi:MAG TPA: cytochrome c oxidase subunit I [Actinomycetes bacterium]|nr:cytochrome c oxidase subunit I [Actinomycetes bacterium]